MGVVGVLARGDARRRLRKGARFTYEYDLNIPWRHEVRIEDHIAAEPSRTYPRCTGGGGACPPEDGGGPECYLAGLDEAMSMEAFEDEDHTRTALAQRPHDLVREAKVVDAVAETEQIVGIADDVERAETARVAVPIGNDADPHGAV